MKRIIVAICVMLSTQVFSQSIFDRFEDSDRIGSVTINKGMLDLVVKMMDDDTDKETQEFVDIAKGINNIKIFMSEDEGAAADIAATMKKYVRSAKLEELMKVRDGDTNVRFYIRTGKDEDHVKELLMFVTGIDEKKSHRSDFHFETVLLTMTGDIDLNKVGALTKKMDLHKGLHTLEKKH